MDEIAKIPLEDFVFTIKAFTREDHVRIGTHLQKIGQMLISGQLTFNRGGLRITRHDVENTISIDSDVVFDRLVLRS